jgi:DNA-binding NarL/FixJ family response regulator
LSPRCATLAIHRPRDYDTGDILMGEATTQPIRILIADDHALVRRGIRATLTERPQWTIVGEADNGRQAVALATTLRPDVAVLDMTMPQLNGLDATRQILAINRSVRILILTVHDSESLIREVFKAGARGYLLKSDAGADLVAAVQALLAGRYFFTSSVAEKVVEGYLRGDAAVVEPAQGALTPRERQILQLLAEGQSNKEIAKTLSISVKTAETHRGNIMRKMEFTSLPDLVRYAIKNGMTAP